MQPERKLELIHLQITKHCNLHCWFCGQWGEQGSFSKKAGSEMQLSDWYRVIEQIEAVAQKQGSRPAVMLWGGEPTASPCFDEIVTKLHERGFSLGMVTNGTLLDRHMAICRQAFHTIYISLDGTPQIHNSIRGAGVYEKVAENIKQLRGSGVKVVLLTVMTEQSVQHLNATLQAFEKLQPDEVLLQERISLLPQETAQYTQWFQHTFHRAASDIFSWQSDSPVTHLPQQWYDTWLQTHSFPFPIHHLPHGKEVQREFCLSPWRHVHIAWNGNVGFCTDFTDFSCGNVKDASLEELFCNSEALQFSQEVLAGRCITCQHCSWRNSDHFGLDG